MPNLQVITGLFSCVLGIYFIALLVYASFMDIRYRILPDTITLLGSLVGVSLSALGLGLFFAPPLELFESTIGGCVGILVFGLIAYVFPKHLGLGDAKFLMMLGTWLGVSSLPIILFVSTLTGILYAKVANVDPVPFGVFLSIGALVALITQRLGFCLRSLCPL